jgi:glycosyltransferase involved in cell wall biosynthesis
VTADLQTLPVAVIIAAHNHSEWVGKAVASALGQRPHPPAEVIVVDDGSTDDTAAAAIRAGATVLRHEENRGAAAARNTGAGATEQPWIAPLDSDDRWLPHMLSTLWPLRDGYGFVAGASVSVDGGDRPLAYGGTLAPEPIVLSSPAPLVYPENFIAASGVIIDRDTFWDAGGYRTAHRQAEDLDLWMRMLQTTTGLCVPEVVTLYRVHPAQKSRAGAESRAAVLGIIERYGEGSWCNPELVESRRAVMAWDELRDALDHRHLLRALSQARWLAGRRVRRRALRGALIRRREARRRAVRWSRLYDTGPSGS